MTKLQFKALFSYLRDRQIKLKGCQDIKILKVTSFIPKFKFKMENMKIIHAIPRPTFITFEITGFQKYLNFSDIPAYRSVQKG